MGKRTLQPDLLHGFVIRYLGYIGIGEFFDTPLLFIVFYLALIGMTILLSTSIFKYVFYPIDWLSKLLFKPKVEIGK